MVDIKSKREIELMKEVCRVTALTHEAIKKAIKPGITTKELDRIAETTIRENGGIPAQLGYPSGEKGVPPFPASICASINDEVIHGIPSDRVKLKEGDVISIDLVAYKNGFNGDAARTYIVGKGSKNAEKLVEVTRQAFFEGIKYAKAGNRIGDVCHAIGEFVRLEPGMTLAIEPMVMIGKPDICVLDDGWTIVTEDESLAAHYENTILITEKEPEILTII